MHPSALSPAASMFFLEMWKITEGTRKASKMQMLYGYCLQIPVISLFIKIVISSLP